jgi:hypothetical protein
MTGPATPADPGGFALKRDGAPLDSCRAMHVQELKLRIARRDYVVDPAAVAEAMLRHALAARREAAGVTGCGESPSQPAGRRPPTA